MNDEQIRRDDVRLDVLNALYHRRSGAHTAPTIRSVYLAGRGYELAEVSTALHDLETLGYAVGITQGMTGSELAWKITGDGLKYKEGAR